MNVVTYTIVLDPDVEGGGYTVTVPFLPGCITQGETLEQCIERAREAIAGHIAALQETGQPVPEEIVRPQVITLDVAIPSPTMSGLAVTSR